MSAPPFPEGVRHALDPAGRALAIVDVTHPAFQVDDSAEALAALERRFLEDDARREKLPGFLVRPLLWLVLRRSLLARGLRGGRFLSGLDTYLYKLGPDLLPPGAAPIDRVIAASLPAVSVRLRLVDMAHLLAEALVVRGPGRLVLVNLGGGACLDSLNALLLLRRDHPTTLEGRAVSILALDGDDVGAAFGARCLASLREGPLAGVDIAFRHARYDWNAPDTLPGLLGGLEGAQVAVSSEGALFEYADDATVRANLAALGKSLPAGAVCVGSVTSDTDLARRSSRSTPIRLQPRSVAAFEALAAAAGWRADAWVERPCCRDVRLVRDAL